MDLQECGQGVSRLVAPDRGAQAIMIGDCLRLQRKYHTAGLVSTDIDAVRMGKRRIPIEVILHQLDMAGQECAEAWDQVEGGWKHHKVNPKAADKDEVAMEMIDVAHFVYNAFLYARGAYKDSEMAAYFVISGLSLPSIDFRVLWSHGTRCWAELPNAELFSHGWGSHGADWEKSCAARINYLRHKINGVTSVFRDGMAAGQIDTDDKNGQIAGFIASEIFPALYSAGSTIPEFGVNEFYSFFKHKNSINGRRIDEKY